MEVKYNFYFSTILFVMIKIIRIFLFMLPIVNDMIKKFLDAIFHHLSSVILLALVNILLFTDNGKDVLIIACENQLKYGFTLIAFIFWIIVVWYSAHLNALSEFINPINKYIPSILLNLGASLFITRLLTLSFNYPFHIFTILLFILLSILYEYFGIIRPKLRPIYIVSLLFTLVLICFLSSIYIFNFKTKFRLFFLAINVFVLYTYVIYIINNRNRITWISRIIPYNFSFLIDKNASFFKSMTAIDVCTNREKYFFFFFNILSSLIFICYLVIILSLKFAVSVGPLAVTIISFTILIGTFNFLAVVSKRIGFNINILLIILALIIGTSHKDMHQINTLKYSEPAYNSVRNSVPEFIDRWLEARNNLDKDSNYVAYIVLSDGGGARSAAWVSKVLSKLEDSTSGNFSKHILAIAGASGGSLGNSIFYSLLSHKEKTGASINCKNYSDAFCKKDFLSYTIARFLSMDYAKYIFGNTFYDRARATELSFEYSELKDNVIEKQFAAPFDSLFSNTGMLPAFFINVTNMKNGTPAYVSNIILSDKQRVNVLNLLPCNLTMSLSTATMLSARFPYISPAGSVVSKEGKYYYFVDGGYFDNSGANTIQSFITEVYSYLKNKPEILKKLQIKIFSIHNGENSPEASKSLHPIENDLLSPFVTLIGIQNANTSFGNEELTQYINQNFKKTNNYAISLYSSKNYGDCNLREETYPMSWTNSNYQLSRMDNRLKNYDLNTILDELKSN